MPLCDHSPLAGHWPDSALMKIFKRKPEGKKCPCPLLPSAESYFLECICTFGCCFSDMQGMYNLVYLSAVEASAAHYV